MNRKQWESLCDGCGAAASEKLRDADTNELFFTNVACKQLDLRNCRCKDYKHRQEIVPDCVQLTPRNIRRLDWLPQTCGYRLVAEGKDLYWWHPLVSGTRRRCIRPGSRSAAGRSASGPPATSKTTSSTDQVTGTRHTPPHDQFREFEIALLGLVRLARFDAGFRRLLRPLAGGRRGARSGWLCGCCRSCSS